MPKIAVILDENTSKGGGFYETSKNYFSAIAHAGGSPYGIPYFSNMVDDVVREFDGFFSIGGFVAFPAAWYLPGQTAAHPASERMDVEIALMKGFLAAQKPVLGMCNGMQVLACLHGSKLRSDLGKTHTEPMHAINITPDSMLAKIVGSPILTVNSRHREAVAEAGPQVKVSARAADGVIEGIEIPAYPFALGVEWHQEDFWREKHAGNAIFAAFVKATR